MIFKQVYVNLLYNILCIIKLTLVLIIKLPIVILKIYHICIYIILATPQT
jgi:hypothetical protein